VAGTDLSAWGRGLGITALALLVLMLCVFAVGRAMGRHRIIDAVWGAAFALVALIGFVLSSGHGDTTRRIVITALTVIWGVRLSVHIGLRGRGQPEDPRYEAMLSRAPGNRTWYAFTRVYLLQGFLVWFISMPVQIGQYSTGPSAFIGTATVVAGCALWLVGFAFEAIGDWQLTQFKADPANRGKLLITGLRRYTRHPNYFGDACIWWGLFLVAADQWAGLLTVLSPIVMTWLLTKGSGQPLMDAHLTKTRPEFAEYAARTSGFWPRRPSS